MSFEKVEIEITKAPPVRGLPAWYARVRLDGVDWHVMASGYGRIVYSSVTEANEAALRYCMENIR